ncbi:MAG: hypothetical protein R2845_15955 [Thermomicrobiales bacterium]
MNDELRYVVSPGTIPEGPQIWEIINTGVHHAHHVVVVGVPAGTTADASSKRPRVSWWDSPAGPGLFAQFAPGGYAALQSGGTTTWVEFDYTLGTWAIICFIMEGGRVARICWTDGYHLRLSECIPCQRFGRNAHKRRP